MCSRPRTGSRCAATSSRRATVRTICASPPSSGRPTSSTSPPCSSSIIQWAPRSSSTNGSRSRRNASAPSRPGRSRRSRRPVTIRARTSPPSSASGTRGTSIRPDVDRTRASPGPTSSSSSFRTRRRAPGRCGSSGAAGSTPPTARSTSPSPRGLTRHPRACRCTSQTRSGRFRQVRAGLGFPAGKDKTILLDLAGLFPPQGPRRLRLATNLEIFWDQLGWAVGRPDVVLSPRRLDLLSADLSYRGYSVTAAAGPEPS